MGKETVLRELRESTRIETGTKIIFISVVQYFQNSGDSLLNLGTLWGG